MGLLDEATDDELQPGPLCHVAQMLRAVKSHPKAEPLDWEELEEVLRSSRTVRAIARALRTRYKDLGIFTPSDQTLGRHRRGECQNCYGAR